MVQANLRIQRLESMDSDPFNLMGPSRSKPTKKLSPAQRRETYTNNIHSMVTETTAATSQDQRRPKSSSNRTRRPSNEIFKILEGQVSEKRIVAVDNEETKEY